MNNNGDLIKCNPKERSKCVSFFGNNKEKYLMKVKSFFVATVGEDSVIMDKKPSSHYEKEVNALPYSNKVELESVSILEFV